MTELSDTLAYPREKQNRVAGDYQKFLGPRLEGQLRGVVHAVYQDGVTRKPRCGCQRLGGIDPLRERLGLHQANPFRYVVGIDPPVHRMRFQDVDVMQLHLLRVLGSKLLDGRNVMPVRRSRVAAKIQQRALSLRRIGVVYRLEGDWRVGAGQRCHAQSASRGRTTYCDQTVRLRQRLQDLAGGVRWCHSCWVGCVKTERD